MLEALADPGNFVPERHRQAGGAWPEILGGGTLPNADPLSMLRPRRSIRWAGFLIFFFTFGF